MDGLQLNLFGDVINFDEYIKTEKENGIELLGNSGKGALGEIPSEQVQAADRERNIGAGAGESSELDGRHDVGTDGRGNAPERGFGDSTTTIYSPYTRDEAGKDQSRIESHLEISGRTVSISEKDVEGILNQYADKHAGFNAATNTTKGFHKVFRESSGTPLWENMNNDERKHEVLEHIQTDF
jgi:hypothetical protein